MLSFSLSSSMPNFVVIMGLIILLKSSPTRCFNRQYTKSLNQKPFKLDCKSENNWELSLKSPCKINLFLRILGRRTSGYHDLASLFQAVSFADDMYFSKLPQESSQDELLCSDNTLAVDRSNLVIKALDLMRAKTGINQYFSVYLDKFLPMQAGLGGGSGNAATAMYAFNRLCGYPASLQNLRDWSGDIGSDITFFFTTGTAYCTGRGEIVDSLPPLPEADNTAVHIFKPAVGLSTASVFKTLELDKIEYLNPESLLDCFTTKGALKAAQDGRLLNDLEPPAFKCEPVLADIKEDIRRLNDGIAGVMMSGSGTSIYALAPLASTLETAGVLTAHPNVNYFKCTFVNKADTVESWYH